MDFSDELKAARQALQHYHHVVVLTGAGVSAESGIPTFRDAQTGLWANFSAEDLATESAFRRDPNTVWAWYQWRRQLINQSQLNQAHHALVSAANQFKQFSIVTQNVDGLHQKAGSDNVLEFHGNIFDSFCLDNRHPYSDLAADQEIAPTCTECDSLVRPGVVWFGEGLDSKVLATSQRWVAECDALLSIGTSSLVYPAADLAHQALTHGAKLFEINLDRTPLSNYCNYVLIGSATKILPALFST